MFTKSGLIEYIRTTCGGGCTLQHLWAKGYLTGFVDEVVSDGDLEYSYISDEAQQYVEKKMGLVDVQLTMEKTVEYMELEELKENLKRTEEKLKKHREYLKRLLSHYKLLKDSIEKRS